jgi:hypothetical protein
MSESYVVIVCPVSGEKLIPEKVWQSRLPNGQSIRYGQFKAHHHSGQDCEWSHLAQPVEEEGQGVGFFL